MGGKKRKKSTRTRTEQETQLAKKMLPEHFKLPTPKRKRRHVKKRPSALRLWLAKTTATSVRAWSDIAAQEERFLVTLAALFGVLGPFVWAMLYVLLIEAVLRLVVDVNDDPVGVIDLVWGVVQLIPGALLAALRLWATTLFRITKLTAETVVPGWETEEPEPNAAVAVERALFDAIKSIAGSVEVLVGKVVRFVASELAVIKGWLPLTEGLSNWPEALRDILIEEWGRVWAATRLNRIFYVDDSLRRCVGGGLFGEFFQGIGTLFRAVAHVWCERHGFWVWLVVTCMLYLGFVLPLLLAILSHAPYKRGMLVVVALVLLGSVPVTGVAGWLVVEYGLRFPRGQRLLRLGPLVWPVDRNLLTVVCRLGHAIGTGIIVVAVLYLVLVALPISWSMTKKFLKLIRRAVLPCLGSGG